MPLSLVDSGYFFVQISNKNFRSPNISLCLEKQMLATSIFIFALEQQMEKKYDFLPP